MICDANILDHEVSQQNIFFESFPCKCSQGWISLHCNHPKTTRQIESRIVPVVHSYIEDEWRTVQIHCIGELLRIGYVEREIS